ncbi:type IV secretory system conjugative DNA transfer family protein [Campylobacter coli]|uniref:type IV secretory system conjugative DNA transfer family protein n=1 Tax=Campylobacter coli TaxID=195 RepID=UPI003F169C3E
MIEEILDSEVQRIKPKKADIVEFLDKNTWILFSFRLFAYISIFLAVLNALFIYNNNFSVFIFTSVSMLCFIASALYLHIEKKDDKEAIIRNESNKKYLISLGVEVKKFYGDAVKSGKRTKNKVRPLLINAETMRRHLMVLATIGAGKSVLMKGLIEQYALLGGGCLIIDGKGTDEFAKEIYGLVASVGREDDFIHLNLLDMDNTHTINPLLSGGALAIYEILLALLIGEENEWKEKQKEFMKNVLKLMVYKRDNEKDFVFDFSALTNMMSLATLIKYALDYKDIAHTNTGLMDFVKYVATTIEIDPEDFIKGDKKDEKWIKGVYEKINPKNSGQGVYDVSVCVGAWRNVLTNLSSDYGKIFNAPNPDISLWEATQRNKIIFVTLPTMDSDTTPRELGRLILGLIKGVAAQKAKFAKEPSIPFAFFGDEFGSYAIEGFGRLESKSRSIGISITPIFQSYAQVDVIAKNEYEKKEILDVTGVHILMKTLHPETTEFYQKMVGKIKVIKTNFTKRREYAKGEGSTEDSYQYEEKPAFEHNEVANMSNGEMMIFANGRMHRAIAQAESSLLKYGKKVTYEGMSDKKIPLTQYVNKRIFIKKVYEILNELEKELKSA